MRTPSGIDRLRALWLDETSPAAWRACWAMAGAGVIAAALVARLGFGWARGVAVALLVLALVPSAARAWVVRRQRRDARSVMQATLMRTEPDLARAALRALSLVERTEADARRGSPELAAAHVARVLGRASLDRLGRFAGAAAWRATGLAVLLAAAGFALVVVDPFRMLEGFDVLVARGGRAPVALDWIELPRLTAEPPAYLNLPRQPLRPYFPVALPAGTTISVHAVPRHDGRQLVLTDGRDEVPFHDDGGGSLVARWSVKDDAELVVAARFGDVLIVEPNELEVHAIADRKPYVRLEGAPASHRLLDTPRIAIHWEATDDHGLREVALVLRAGEREERRELSKPQGGVAIDRGGIELSAEDDFLKKSYLPVEVTVEALDNDPVTGPKWGRSAAIVLVPPEIGEREAMMARALQQARDGVTDLLARRLESGAPSAVERAAYFAADEQEQRRVTEELLRVSRTSFGGLRMRGALASLVRGQVERLEADRQGAARGAPQGFDKLVTRTENVLLAIDSALGALGAHESRLAALKMSEVATDAAHAIELSRDPAERARATRRLEADLTVLEGGGKHLLALGRLGVDLGEIVANGLRRIRRAWDAEDRLHARLAAEDLAARLRMPDPSFGSSGGGHGHGGGVESGGRAPPSAGDASSAAQDAAGVEQALEQLRQEHAAEMEAVRRALEQAMSPEDRQALEQQLREQAKAVREAVSQLPQQAADPSSARAAAAQARSQAEAMAGALERGEPKQAAEHGQRALESLERAQRQGGGAPEGSDERAMGELSAEAHGKLRRELEHTRRMLQERGKNASEQAKGQLERSARRERELAERARELRRRSAESDAPLPGEMLERLNEAADAMDDAARELDRANGDKGLEQQREAQRLLELAQPEADEREAKGSEGDGGRDFARDADVPPEARDAAADAFRKRVTDGLGRGAPPHLKEAIRRYTEGLLR